MLTTWSERFSTAVLLLGKLALDLDTRAQKLVSYDGGHFDFIFVSCDHLLELTWSIWQRHSNTHQRPLFLFLFRLVHEVLGTRIGAAYLICRLVVCLLLAVIDELTKVRWSILPWLWRRHWITCNRWLLGLQFLWLEHKILDYFTLYI